VEGRLADVRALFARRGGALVDLVKTFAAPVSGVIDARERRIEEQSSVLRDRIDRIDARLDKKRAALLAQYSRYEGVIGRLQSIGSSLGTQLSSLNRSSKD
jgi:flagellar capping protein FliD